MAKFFLKIGFLLAVFAGLNSLATAQIPLIPPILSISASPASPAPGEQVTMSALTPTFDKNSAYFEWVVNGAFRPDLSGPAKHTITLTAGDIGSSISVSVDVAAPDGSQNSASIVIRSADLSLLWFAETYTPRWYKGKALPVQRSTVRLVAVPDFAVSGARISPEKLIYVWDFDDEKRVLAGMGERVFRIKTGDFLKSGGQVTVTVENTDRKIRKEKRIIISNTAPRVAVYPLLPLGGIETRSANLENFSFSEVLDLIAEPFFFAVSSKKELSFRWDVAGISAEGVAANPDILTLRSSGPTDTPVSTSVSVNDRDIITPSASKFFTLTPR